MIKVINIESKARTPVPEGHARTILGPSDEGTRVQVAITEVDPGKSSRLTASDRTQVAYILEGADARITYTSHGIPERGDAQWLDHQGSFMAAIAAQPVYRLLGAKDLGRSDDYKTEKMPAVLVSMLDGQLAWRQHDGGHTDAPNWKYFIPWADRMLARTPAVHSTR